MGTHKSTIKNVGDGEGKLSYKQVVAESSPSVSAIVVFKGVIRRQNLESKLRGGEGRWVKEMEVDSLIEVVPLLV